jgi:hypothetical protein
MMMGLLFIGLKRMVLGINIESSWCIFTAELTALFVTLRHIGKIIQPPERCLMLTDSLSSVKALFPRKIYHIGFIRGFTNCGIELRLK